jgi:hypothetical protein
MSETFTTNPVLTIEHCWTRDRVEECSADGSTATYPVPPPGQGWVIADYTHETRTKWRRVSLTLQHEGAAP